MPNRRGRLRHITLLRAVLILFVVSQGCDGSGNSRAIALQWLEALNRQDSDQLITMLHPSATYIDPSSEALMSPATLRPWLESTWASWRERRYTPGAIVATNDSVVIEWRLAQTHTDGTSVPADGITLIEHDGRRILYVRDYYNAVVYLQLLKAG